MIKCVAKLKELKYYSILLEIDKNDKKQKQ